MSWKKLFADTFLSPIQDEGVGGGQKGPPTSISHVASTNGGISPKIFCVLFLTILPH